MLLYLWSHVSVSHLDTVDQCLVLEQLLYGNLLRDHAVRIAIPFHAFHRCLHTVCLNVGLQDGLVANDPDDLVDDGAHVDGVAVGGDAVSCDAISGSHTRKARKARCASKGSPDERETYEQGYYQIPCRLHQCWFTVFNTSSYIFTA